MNSEDNTVLYEVWNFVWPKGILLVIAPTYHLQWPTVEVTQTPIYIFDKSTKKWTGWVAEIGSLNYEWTYDEGTFIHFKDISQTFDCIFAPSALLNSVSHIGCPPSIN